VAVSVARVLVGEIDCGGMAIDRYGNFYFANRIASTITKIAFQDLKSNHSKTSAQIIEMTVLYSNSTALELDRVLDLHIDRDCSHKMSLLEFGLTSEFETTYSGQTKTLAGRCWALFTNRLHSRF
jgi:hypothetical protein